MTIFISYSVKDNLLVERIATLLRVQGHAVYWWQGSNEPGDDMWPQIFGWIDQSDLVLAVITDAVVKRAMAIGNEIGYAKGRKKIVPLVASGVPVSELGCLQGIVHIPLDLLDPKPAIDRLLAYTKPPAPALQPAMDPWAALLLIGVVVLLIAALASEK
jgi:hypothetical protein